MLKFYDLQSINLLIKTLSLYLAINLTFISEIKTCDWVDDLRSISLMTCVSVDDSVSLMTWVWLLMINEFKRLDLVLITFEFVL